MLCLTIYFGLITLNVCTSAPLEFTKNSWDRQLDDGECKQLDLNLYCHYIPTILPLNVTHLYLENAAFDFRTFNKLQPTNWNNIKFLQLNNCMVITAGAMKNLLNLEELHLVGTIQFRFGNVFAGLLKSENAFATLKNLKVLSLSGGTQKLTVSVIKAMAFENVLPNLEAFSIKDTTLVMGKEENDSIIFRAIKHRHLKSLDMNFVKTDDFDLLKWISFVPYLEKLNISYSSFYSDHNFFDTRLSLKKYPTNGNFSLFFDPMPGIEVINDLKVFDASYVYSPVVNGYVKYVLELQKQTKYITLPLEIVSLVSRAEIVNISGINKYHNKVKVKRLSVDIFQYYSGQSPTGELIVKNNNLQFLDVTFPCKDSKLERLDLSVNVIEFIRPQMCPCCTRLLEINMSNNNLFKMADSNHSLFGQLISSYPNLRNVQLSLNKLTEIPTEMFRENIYLKQIDLSDNYLTNITFNLGDLSNLKTLNLKNNRISHLDHTSLTNLHSIYVPSFSPTKKSGILKIDDNPILCSECDILPSIKWLATTPLVNREENNIMCKYFAGRSIPVDQNTAKQLKQECDRPKWIRKVVILSTTIPLATAAFMFISICKLLRYRRRRLRRKNIEEKIELIRQNQLDTRFVVFLSYSSEDTEFLNEYVYNPLKIHLQERVQTERDIICLGDRHFQLGKPINDEMVQTLQQSAVVLLLLSRNFCKSEFCRMEFDHAFFMKKPFILMVKGEIDVNEMVPSLQEVFKRNTRLLWERGGDKFVMKTSWDNVSSSILDLIS